MTSLVSLGYSMDKNDDTFVLYVDTYYITK